MEKIFNQKNFNNYIWSFLGSRGNIYINFCLQVHFQVSAAWYCSNYLPPVSMTLAANLLPVSLTPVANLPPVSTTQGELVAKFAAGVVDTGGKFAAGFVDNGGNLPPVSTTPGVHLDLRISPRIFEKIWNDPNVIIRGLGEKTWSKKSRDTVPLTFTCPSLLWTDVTYSKNIKNIYDWCQWSAEEWYGWHLENLIWKLLGKYVRIMPRQD